MKWDISQVDFQNSARFSGRFAHGSLLARGRSSAHTTYFPVWKEISNESLEYQNFASNKHDKFALTSKSWFSILVGDDEISYKG